MAKTKISEYSATANSNTDVASINIDEGCAPSGINNAIRAVMGHLKDFQAGTNGDSFNGPVNGTVGATTPAAGAFTTLSASSTLSVTGAGSIQGLTVGKGAGSVATNTAVGASALAANTTGLANHAFGYQTLLANTSGSYGTAIGYQALAATTTVNGLTAVGAFALTANTSGVDNTAIGLNTLKANTTGGSNFAGGREALLANTSGGANTAVGMSSLYSNTTASYNTAVGYQAGYSNTVTAGNTFVGYRAGYTSNRTADANGYNTAIGHNSGYSLTTGQDNQFFGQGSGYYVTTGRANTIVGTYNGNQGGLDIRTASNCIVLSDGDGNPSIFGVKNATSFDLTSNSSGGNTGIGWRVNNSLKFNAWVDVGASDRLQITDADYSNGVILTQNSNSWSAYSDERLKQNIAPLSFGLDVVSSLEPVTYEWKKQGRPDVGFIAQRTKLAAPMSVIGAEEDFFIDENGRARGAMSIMHDKLIPYMVKAIQELNAQQAALKAEFDAYKATHP